MQPHEGPRQPPEPPPQDTMTWWLLLIIFALLGMIAGQLILRWS
jgi:hypothetical protein